MNKAISVETLKLVLELIKSQFFLISMKIRAVHDIDLGVLILPL